MEVETNNIITNITRLTCGTGTAYPSGAHEFSPGFSGFRVTQSLVLCVCFVDRCLSFCPCFFWPLCCLFFFDIRILITPVVSSNPSYIGQGVILIIKYAVIASSVTS